MYFEREKEVCNSFVQRFKRQENKIAYEISIKAISIVVKSKNWKNKRGGKYLNFLIKKNNLAYIGYRSKCLILKKTDKIDEVEYFIPMKNFNMNNYYSSEY